MARPKSDPSLKKEQIGIKLPRWLIDWLSSQPESRAQVIERAVCKVHRLKAPRSK